MTLDAAINMLTHNAKYVRKSGDLQGYLDFKQLVKWLRDYKQLKEQEPSGDLISRKAVCDYIAEFINHEYSTDAECEMVDLMIKGIQHMPSVNPQEPKTGHWIVDEGVIYCSKCGCGALYDKVYPGESVFGKAIRVKSTFCPTCGVKMSETLQIQKWRGGE